MSTYQQPGDGDLGGFGQILESIRDGVVIAVLNIVMMQFFTSLAKLDTPSSPWAIDYIGLVQIEWVLIVFAINVASVLAAYGLRGWLGVIVYLGGWMFIASQIPQIGIGFLPILVGLLILAGKEYVQMQSGSNVRPRR